MRTPSSFIPGYGQTCTPREEARWEARRRREIGTAYRQGLTCLGRGERSRGLFWLERAERLAGRDDNISFTCAMALLEDGAVRQAIARLQPLWTRLGVRETGLALAAALLRVGEAVAGMEVMATVLACNNVAEAHYGLADSLSLPLGLPGWAALSNAGTVRVRVAGQARLWLDGVVLGQVPAGVHALAGLLPAGAAPWWQGRRLDITSDDRPVLGSPLDIQALIRCESFVTVREQAVQGWLWHPGEPDFHPALLVEGTASSLLVANPAEGFRSTGLLQRPYGFRLPCADWPRFLREPTGLYDQYGRLLRGAPITPALVRLMQSPPSGSGRKGWSRQGCRKPRRPPPATPLSGNVAAGQDGRKEGSRGRGCAVIMPVYQGEAMVRAALACVLATVPRWCDVIVIDDATPGSELRAHLAGLARAGQVTLRRHEENRGFVASINTGLALVPPGRDVILLNSDTLVFGNWVERLCRWLGRERAGTVTPFSNAGGLTSYPVPDRDNPAPAPEEAARLDSLCRRLPPRPPVMLPTANGFCMGISAACLAVVGSLREAFFAQGYGEENDFCLRASEAGFHHLAAPDVYVLHHGHESFGAEAAPLRQRNLAILNRLYPGYDAAIRRWKKAAPLHMVRRMMDWQRLAEHRQARDGAVLLIQHRGGGGVARAVREQAAGLEAAGLLVLVLEPTGEGCRIVSPVAGLAVPNLAFVLPDEHGRLLAFLREMGVRRVVWHHLLGHEAGLRQLHHQLGVPCDMHVHDHIWFCPRIALLDRHGRYCGEPDLAGCRACLGRGDVPVDEGLPLEAYLARSRRELAQARRIVTPSMDAARRLARHLPETGPVLVEPLEDDRQIRLSRPPPRRGGPPPAAGAPLRVLVLGGISRWKGYDVLLALGRHVRHHDLPLRVTLVGGTHDDDALINAGVEVTGPYRDEELPGLLEHVKADVGFVPSIAPETWCYTLGWLWKAGLGVIGFDIGASAERIRQAGPEWGQLLPLGVPVEQLATVIMGTCYRGKRI